MLDGAASAVVGHEVLEGAREGTFGGSASHLQIGYQGHCGEIWLLGLHGSEAGWAFAEEVRGAGLTEGVTASVEAGGLGEHIGALGALQELEERVLLESEVQGHFGEFEEGMVKGGQVPVFMERVVCICIWVGGASVEELAVAALGDFLGGEEAFVFLLEVVALVLEPEVDHVGEEGEDDQEADVLVPLDLYHLVGEPFPPHLLLHSPVPAYP